MIDEKVLKKDLNGMKKQLSEMFANLSIRHKGLNYIKIKINPRCYNRQQLAVHKEDIEIEVAWGEVQI